jgi:hypothetical protein
VLLTLINIFQQAEQKCGPPKKYFGPLAEISFFEKVQASMVAKGQNE